MRSRTVLLGVLCSQHRYAHLSALRFDPVNPGLLGMGKVVSEDSVRRYLAAMSAEQSEQWLRGRLRECYGPLLLEPWVLDVDTTIKPIHGHQDAAKKGYNPTKPGRPSLAYHSYFNGTLRVCLDVEAGDQCAAKHGHAALWRLIDELPAEQRPAFIRGDLAYGEETLMSACEGRGQKYLFKLRQSPKVKDLIKVLEKSGRGAWQDAGQGFEGIESRLKLQAWSQERRVIVLRRPVKRSKAKSDLPLLEEAQIVLEAGPTHEFMVHITSLDYSIGSVAQLYRDRADVENCFDELKKQWGWGGFTTRDLARSQTMARFVALVYNWWSLFVGLIEPGKHAEAITSRPQLLHGVARVTQSGRQTTLSVTNTHQRATRAWHLRLSVFVTQRMSLTRCSNQ